MTTGQIVAIVVLVLLVALVAAAILLRKRSPNVRKAEAAQHRQQAEQRRASAERLEAEAAERAERARAEHAQATKLAEMAAHDRQVAEKAAAEAVRLDPDYTEQTAQETGRHAVVERPAHQELESATHDDHVDAERERARRVESYNQEPIVAGAAEGMIKPRRGRQAAETDPAGDTVTRPVSAPRPASDQETRPNRTVGDEVRERADRPAAVDTGTDQHEHQTSTLADRIMGRA
jgi:hypothetical protein